MARPTPSERNKGRFDGYCFYCEIGHCHERMNKQFHRQARRRDIKKDTQRQVAEVNKEKPTP